jgi:hypothetical protein
MPYARDGDRFGPGTWLTNASLVASNAVLMPYSLRVRRVGTRMWPRFSAGMDGNGSADVTQPVNCRAFSWLIIGNLTVTPLKLPKGLFLDSLQTVTVGRDSLEEPSRHNCKPPQYQDGCYDDLSPIRFVT